MNASDPRWTSTFALVAISVWLGGILALGAIVAPIVFNTIPRPEAADAMILVFQRFDLVAIGCVAVIVATEIFRTLAPPTPGARVRKIGRIDIARMLTGVAGAILVLTEALWITPTIVDLHRHGAIRGFGGPGLELDRMHRLAESCGKVQVALALALVALHVVTLSVGAGDAAKPDDKVPGGAAHGA
jgi:hypothetical protein